LVSHQSVICTTAVRILSTQLFGKGPSATLSYNRYFFLFKTIQMKKIHRATLVIIIIALLLIVLVYLIYQKRMKNLEKEQQEQPFTLTNKISTIIFKQSIN
jgi:positive regulator of sigma E activity